MRFGDEQECLYPYIPYSGVLDELAGIAIFLVDLQYFGIKRRLCGKAAKQLNEALRCSVLNLTTPPESRGTTSFIH